MGKKRCIIAVVKCVAFKGTKFYFVNSLNFCYLLSGANASESSASIRLESLSLSADRSFISSELTHKPKFQERLPSNISQYAFHSAPFPNPLTYLKILFIVSFPLLVKNYCFEVNSITVKQNIFFTFRTHTIVRKKYFN